MVLPRKLRRYGRIKITVISQMREKKGPDKERSEGGKENKKTWDR